MEASKVKTPIGGDIRTVRCDDEGRLEVVVTSGGGGGGSGTSDTTEATQLLVKAAVEATNTAIGATSSAIATAGGSGNVSAKLRLITSQFSRGVLGAGTALIGKVGIDQTTPGTTNAVSIVGRVTKTDKSGTITSGGTQQTLMVANASRLGWQLQNVSTTDLWFNELGSSAVVGQPSFKLGPGDSYESPVSSVSTAAISIIGATTGQAFTAREW
jgi:hypothetical protein